MKTFRHNNKYEKKDVYTNMELTCIEVFLWHNYGSIKQCVCVLYIAPCTYVENNGSNHCICQLPLKITGISRVTQKVVLTELKIRA